PRAREPPTLLPGPPPERRPRGAPHEAAAPRRPRSYHLPVMAAHPELREVAVEQGALRFRVPGAWVSEREDDGTDAYYEGDGKGGVLRVKVMTFTSPDVLTPRVALAELEAMEAQPGQSLAPLPNGNALRAHREELEADG